MNWSNPNETLDSLLKVGEITNSPGGIDLTTMRGARLRMMSTRGGQIQDNYREVRLGS